MLNIAICDDSKEFLEQIRLLLDCWKDNSRPFLCHTFDNGDSLISAHSKIPFDVILLDVVMPLLNGIETARAIRKIDSNVKIVFLTSSAEYAVDSYTVKANNYLLKPVNSDALYLCLEELFSEIAQSARTLTIKELYSVKKVPLDHIEFVEAQNKHIIFYLNNGSIIETTEPLRILEDKLILNDGFFRCHRSYIVNISYIDTYTLKEVTLRSGKRIPISRSCHKDFENAYFSVTFGNAGEVK